MQDAPLYASPVMTAGSHASAQDAPAAAASQEEPFDCGVASDGRVEVRELLSRRRELADLVAGARRENDVLRAHAERSAAALDAGRDESETSRALTRHADNVRRTHEEMRAVRTLERGTERKLRKKVCRMP